MTPGRKFYLIATCLSIGMGLLARSALLGLPPIIAKYTGSIIWGGMVYFAWAVVRPEQRRSRRAIIAVIIAVTVEFSQLLHTGWLDAVRRTTIGVLLIGRFFSWWDIVSYLIGIAIAVMLEWTIVRFRYGFSTSPDRLCHPKSW